MKDLDQLIGPLPFSRTLGFHNPDDSPRSIRVIDHLGRIVWSWMLSPGSIKGVNTSSWESGVYEIRIEGQQHRRQVIKLNQEFEV